MFFELADIAANTRRGQNATAISPIALDAVKRIDALFDIERGINGLSAEKRLPTAEQCKAYAAEYKILGNDGQISARKSSVLLGISRSWTALAHQLEHLTEIVKSERE